MKLLRSNVPPIEVGKYYLEAELSKIFADPNFKELLHKSIEKLDDKQFWRLLEALSFSYRLNGVFWFVSDQSLSWSEEVLNVKDLTLNGMSPQIDKVIFSDEVNQNPIAFRDHLINYFERHPTDDPEELGQFRPSGRKIEYPTLMLREENDKLSFLDGINRLVSIILSGGDTVTAIVGRKNGKESKRRLGDSTFWLLRRVYQSSDNVDDKEAILKTVRILMKQSLDGDEAVKSYWINHVREEEMKKVGESLISGVDTKALDS